MATIVVRNVPDDVKARLVERAHSHKRSMEAEVRAIIADAVEPEGDWLLRFMESADEFRREFGGVDLEIPARDDFGREVDLE